MSRWEFEAEKAIERLESGDESLECINLSYLTQEKLTSFMNRLVECLATLPNGIRQLYLNGISLSDGIGANLAKFVASSTTIELLALQYNNFGVETYLLLANALHVNTSLHILHMEYNKRDVDRDLINKAFIYALRYNPDRCGESFWRLYEQQGMQNDYKILRTAAEQLGHPTLQMLLWDKV